MKEEMRVLNNKVAELLGERANIKMGNIYYSSILKPFYFNGNINIFERIYQKVKYRKEMARCLEISRIINVLFERINILQRMIESEETIGFANENPEITPPRQGG